MERIPLKSQLFLPRTAAFRLPCASLLLFRRAKVLVLHDDGAVGRSAQMQIRRDNAVRRSAQTRARFSSVQATSSTPTGGPSTCMRSVILHIPSGYALGITQYYFAHIRGRHLVGVLLLLHIPPCHLYTPVSLMETRHFREVREVPRKLECTVFINSSGFHN